MAKAGVRSKGVVLLLLIRCLVCFPLVVGSWSVFVHYFVSFLVVQSPFRWRERAYCFAFIVSLMSCYCKYSMTLPHGAVVSLCCVIVVFPDHTNLCFELPHATRILSMHMLPEYYQCIMYKRFSSGVVGWLVICDSVFLGHAHSVCSAYLFI